MGEEKAKPVGGVWPTIKPFVNGGASGMLATCVIQPIDMIKFGLDGNVKLLQVDTQVRIQLGQGSAVSVTKEMLKNEGVGAFYKGLSAGLLRQATYTTARLGTFRILTNKALEANDGKPLPLYQKALCGLTAGAIGACVGSPADLALIRMQADATLPAAQRRNYTNAFHALYRITADEGVLALWKGAGPTVVRAMALNMGMLASYDQSVEFFKDNLGAGEAATILETQDELLSEITLLYLLQARINFIDLADFPSIPPESCSWSLVENTEEVTFDILGLGVVLHLHALAWAFAHAYGVRMCLVSQASQRD
ncbi:hypothetical protein M8C21_011650 [Ambrosia artemisiifolia]|uniref:Mitochondrial dicarboxylate/tricarboxylate transporter DTC n=1 Tax=Ambrosia artemisiifolia TaxID=4212 RepID=A0AAD5DEQ6_AMBAR|nr:hypothetical protein M8C21_011650 [Ambrosia artemisiifolia]